MWLFFNKNKRSSQSPPYGMLKESSAELSGNDRFEGFGVDVIHELSLMLGFKYIFRLQDNGVYGSKNNVTKEWNGMIREVIDKVGSFWFFFSLGPCRA